MSHYLSCTWSSVKSFVCRHFMIYCASWTRLSWTLELVEDRVHQLTESLLQWKPLVHQGQNLTLLNKKKSKPSRNAAFYNKRQLTLLRFKIQSPKVIVSWTFGVIALYLVSGKFIKKNIFYSSLKKLG